MVYSYQTSPSTEHRKKSNRHVRFIVFLFFTVFFCWFIYEIIRQYGYMQEKKEILAQLKTQLDEAQQLHESSTTEIERLKDTEYLEQKIRKELNYTKPGETIFYVPQAKEESSEN